MPRKRKHTFETEKEAFPTNLRALLDEMDIAQEALANVIGMTRQAISKYTTGQSTPDIKTLSKMADYFGVSCDYLLGRTEVKTPDVTTKEMHDITGLSEKAITALINNKKNSDANIDRLMFLNDLLVDDETLYFLSGAYCELVRHRKLVDEVERIEYDNPIALESKRNEDYKLFRCQNMFAMFLCKGAAQDGKHTKTGRNVSHNG